MAKKPKFNKPVSPAVPQVPAQPLLSKRGKIVIGIGILTVALGFYLLTFTDPAGQNWASNLCPFVIIGGYVLIGIGIVLPDPDPRPNSVTPLNTSQK